MLVFSLTTAGSFGGTTILDAFCSGKGWQPQYNETTMKKNISFLLMPTYLRYRSRFLYNVPNGMTKKSYHRLLEKSCLKYRVRCSKKAGFATRFFMSTGLIRIGHSLERPAILTHMVNIRHIVYCTAPVSMATNTRHHVRQGFVGHGTGDMAADTSG